MGNKGHYKKLYCLHCGDTEISHFKESHRTICLLCYNKRSKTRYQSLSPDVKKARYKNFTTEQKKEYIDHQILWMANNLIKYRVLSAKHRAKRTNMEFSITTEIMEKKLLEQENKCYISKVPLSMNPHSWYVVSIDRLDSSKGYTPENSILVTKFINIAKNDLSVDEFKKLLKESIKYIL